MSETVKLGTQQQQVLDMLLAFAKSSTGVFQVHGRAGTGKTSVVRELTRRLGYAPVVAPTNKAASVLTSKGVPAGTIHKFLYVPSEAGTLAEIEAVKTALTACDPEEDQQTYKKLTDYLRELKRPVFALRRDLLRVPLVILDEASMVDTTVAADLIDHTDALIAFGDPWQLPPVKGRQFFKPPANATLTQIYRQAQGSGILDAAASAYRNYYASLPRSQDVRTLNGATLSPREYLSVLLDADQVLVGTHKTRKLINHALRATRGSLPLPIAGDTLMCVRSPSLYERDLGLVNGFSYRVLDTRLRKSDGMLWLRVEDETDRVSFVYRTTLRAFLRATLPLDTVVEDERQPPLDFDAALTVHKGQGSEFPRVIVQNEASVFPGLAHKWLYTALTRAQSHVTVVTGMPSGLLDYVLHHSPGYLDLWEHYQNVK